MPQKEFSGGSGSDPATVMRTLDGHKARERHLGDLDAQELYAEIDCERNVHEMTEVGDTSQS